MKLSALHPECLAQQQTENHHIDGVQGPGFSYPLGKKTNGRIPIFQKVCNALGNQRLLYSALLVAALSGGPLQGAWTMALFAVGSGLWLVGGPLAWRWVRQRLGSLRGDWGTRISGALLCGVAVWALWMDLVYKPSLWCR
jgi:hypothetical protein